MSVTSDVTDSVSNLAQSNAGINAAQPGMKMEFNVNLEAKQPVRAAPVLAD